MNTAQRVVLVVALGLGMAVVVTTINAVLWDPWSNGGGWFNYAPESGLVLEPSGSGSYQELDDGSTIGPAVVWLLGISMWTALALLVLRRPDVAPQSAPEPHPED